ncbi:hypothetical protein WSM22_18350 [Cytophagales bacterium WSM2-2]|nr:hypothetical protein WSM22_18350 [Cytophagales bacterium WSM2-2]
MVPKVSRNKARIVCPIFNESQYPYQGFGFKLGDPMALTYKLYPSRNWSLAADVGRSSSGLYHDYYKGLFKGYTQDTLTYLTHKVSSDWFVEGKVLHQWSAEKVSTGLMLYAGLGWQWRSTSLTYNYSHQIAPPGIEYGSFSTTRVTSGPVVILGFEYSYFTWPISAFIEVEMFTDTVTDPGYHRFQGGVGVRYVF